MYGSMSRLTGPAGVSLVPWPGLVLGSLKTWGRAVGPQPRGSLWIAFQKIQQITICKGENIYKS